MTLRAHLAEAYFLVPTGSVEEREIKALHETACKAAHVNPERHLDEVAKRSPAKPPKFYSIDHEGAIEEHDSAASAKESAQWSIDNALDDTWPEGMTRVQWGTLNPIQECVEIDRKERPPEGDPAREEWPDSDLDYTCAYTLQDVREWGQQ